MTLNMGGLVDRWYPVMDVAPHNGTPKRVIWSDAVDAYLAGLPGPQQGNQGWRKDQDDTICEGCGCMTFNQGPLASRLTTTVSTNPTKVSTGTSAWTYGTTQALAAAGATSALNYAGASIWSTSPLPSNAGWIGTNVASTTSGASRSDSTENWYATTFALIGTPAMAMVTWQAAGDASIAEIWINGRLVGVPGPNEVLHPVSGQVSFSPLPGTNVITVKVTETVIGTTSIHGWWGAFSVSYVSRAPFTNPLADNQWWTSVTQPESTELLGYRIWPGTEITTRTGFVNQGGSDTVTGQVVCGKTTVTATIQVTSTTARASQYGIDLLLSTLANSCSCGSCNGIDLALYAGCDPAASPALGSANTMRRTLRNCKLIGWVDTELDPPLPIHNGRLITITMEAEDGRFWIDSTIPTGANNVVGTSLPLQQNSVAVPNTLPGPRYTNTYSYTQDRTAWPVEFRSDGTACPVGQWSPLTVLQPVLGGTGTGYIYGDSYTRVEPDCKHPVRIIWDRTISLLYYETIGWTWPTGVPLPCDFDIDVTEYVQRNAANTAFDTASNPSGSECCLWVQPSAPSAMVVGSTTIPAQGPNNSRGLLSRVGPYAGTYAWTPDATFQLGFGCTFKVFRTVADCPPCLDTQVSGGGALLVTMSMAANGQMSWVPNAWTYNGGTFPPNNKSFAVNLQTTAGVASTVTVVEDSINCILPGTCPPAVPPIRPAILDLCIGGVFGGALNPFKTGAVAIPTLPAERCGTVKITVTTGSSSSTGAFTIFVWDTTVTAALPVGFTFAQLWATQPVATADLPALNINQQIVLDGANDVTTMDCNVTTPGLYVQEFEPWGPHGVWVPPLLQGGHQYQVMIVTPDTTTLAKLTVLVELVTFSRG